MLAVIILSGCSGEDNETPIVIEKEFLFGADLSYVNQILDKGGIYKVEGKTENPYKIFADKGTEIIRLRLWHNPRWTKDIYGEDGTQMYNDLADVEKSISAVKQNGMKVLLDFHYSDRWADPANQDAPAAWSEISSIDILADSIYDYTLKTLTYLSSKDLLPDFVQIGNEINCGMLATATADEFPALNVCEGNWAEQGKVINAAIRAVRKVGGGPDEPRVILHVADPKNVEWWFDNIIAKASVSDYDIIGFSYYPLWHTTVSVSELSEKVRLFKARYSKEVMLVETGYPWTTEADDNYNNHFGAEPAISGFPKTPQGQHEMLVTLTQEMKDGGGMGIIYWEPAWISSEMKDLWGTGSSWENCAFFDFEGNAHKGFDYMH